VLLGPLFGPHLTLPYEISCQEVVHLDSSNSSGLRT